MPETVKFTTDSLDSVEEALRPFYVEGDDGKFHLNGDPNTLSDYSLVGPLKRANERNKEDLAATKAELADAKAKISNIPDDFDAEKWAKLKDGKPDEAAQIALRKEYDARIADLEGKLTATQEAALKTAIERDLTDALTSAGFTEAAVVELARTKLASEVKIGDDGKPFVETDMGPITPAERVNRLAAGEWKGLVTAPKGGGSKGGDSSGNPTAPKGDLAGDKDARKAALKARFPDLTE